MSKERGNLLDPSELPDPSESETNDPTSIIVESPRKARAGKRAAVTQSQDLPANPSSSEIDTSSMIISKLESMMERMMTQHASSTRETMESMMESINKRMDQLEETRSRHSASRSRHSSPRPRRTDLSPVPLLPPPERYHPSKDSPVPAIDPESRLLDPASPGVLPSTIDPTVPVTMIDSAVLLPTIDPIISASADKRDQS